MAKRKGIYSIDILPATQSDTPLAFTKSVADKIRKIIKTQNNNELNKAFIKLVARGYIIDQEIQHFVYNAIGENCTNILYETALEISERVKKHDVLDEEEIASVKAMTDTFKAAADVAKSFAYAAAQTDKSRPATSKTADSDEPVSTPKFYLQQKTEIHLPKNQAPDTIHAVNLPKLIDTTPLPAEIEQG